MSINVEQAIIHAICQDNDGQLSYKLRPQPLCNNQALTAMLDDLHQKYITKAGKGFGHFQNDDQINADDNQFKTALSAYLDDNLGFVEFSTVAVKLLQQELAKYNFSQGGFLLLCCYTSLTTDYLFIALLNAKPSMTVLDDMELSQNNHLDLDHIQLAARIDLTEWQTDANSIKYLSFIKGRAGRKVADFFLDFMGSVEGVDSKIQNRQLMKAVEDFVATDELTNAQAQEYRDKVFNYCNQRCVTGDDIELKQLATELADAQQESFYDFANRGDYQLNDEFPADKSSLKQLKRFSGTGAGVTISFDSQHLGERVIYDPHSDSILIKGVPANLKDQLDRCRKNID